MISKAKAKYIKSLQVKKYRIQEQCFLVEGAKSVEELLRSNFEVEFLVATEAYLHERLPAVATGIEVVAVKESELAGLGTLQTNDSVLAVARTKPNQSIELEKGEFGLLLDDIRDPGNLGTILRTADWYGITKILASEYTADLYNPKTIIASMGSFARVQIYFCNLVSQLDAHPAWVYGALLQGESVHHCHFRNAGWIAIGNESRGISEEVMRLVNGPITIPRFGECRIVECRCSNGSYFRQPQTLTEMIDFHWQPAQKSSMRFLFPGIGQSVNVPHK